MRFARGGMAVLIFALAVLLGAAGGAQASGSSTTSGILITPRRTAVISGVATNGGPVVGNTGTCPRIDPEYVIRGNPPVIHVTNTRRGPCSLHTWFVAFDNGKLSYSRNRYGQLTIDTHRPGVLYAGGVLFGGRIAASGLSVPRGVRRVVEVVAYVTADA